MTDCLVLLVSKNDPHMEYLLVYVPEISDDFIFYDLIHLHKDSFIGLDINDRHEKYTHTNSQFFVQ